nr:unnamed protein product [Naegleria fowleri]
MIFDLVYLKDRDITQYPLQKRRAYLESIINPVSHVLEIVPQKPVTSEKEVYEQLDQAILNRDEGIMLKGLSGTYVPGERKWVKLKPDSVDGMGETLDLIIIGGFYGTKFKRKSVSHFLLAVATKSKHSFSKSDGFENLDYELMVNDENQVFHSFCKVGSGYTSSELLALQKELEPHWKPFDKTKLPKFYGSWVPGAGELPDVYIEPKNSKILEIKGYSFQDSTKFKTGITLRFPRVVSIRNDKDWNDCLDLPGLEEMVELSRNGTNKRKAASMDSVISHNDVKKQKRKKNTTTTTIQNSDGTATEVASSSAKNRRPTAAVSQFFDHDMSKLEKTSNIFKGMQFVVFNGDENFSKYEIEKLIVSNGGSKVQNPNDHENQHLIAANTNNITVKNWITSSKAKKNPLGDRDIIHYKWIIDSVSQSSIQRLHPGYMIYTSERTQYSFKEQMDEFQDEYLFDATEESIKVSLQLTKNSPEFMMADSPIIETINTRYNIKTSTSFFKGVRAYIDKFVKIGDASSGVVLLGMETLEVFISLYGGSLSERLDSSVTHIVYDEDDTSRLKTLKRVATKEGLFLVPRTWIMSCVQAKKLQAIPSTNG